VIWHEHEPVNLPYNVTQNKFIPTPEPALAQVPDATAGDHTLFGGDASDGGTSVSTFRTNASATARLATRRMSRRSAVQAGATGLAGAALARIPHGAMARAQATPYDGEEATITYGFWDTAQQAAIESQMAAFNEQFPNITVELQIVPWEDYWTKLQTGVAGGETFDVLWINAASLPVYAASGSLLPIDDIVGDGGIDAGLFPEALVEMYAFEGTQYGLPRDFDTIALFYNRDLFDAANVDYPTGEWTWEDFRQAAEQLTDDGSGVWGAGLQTSWQENYYNFILQNEGQLLNEDGTRSLVDEPEACEAFEFLTGFFTDELTPSLAVQQANPVADTLFPAGQVAMMTGGSFRAGAYSGADANLDVAPLPIGKQRATVIHGLANVIWAGTEQPGASLELVRFLADEEAELILGESGATIPAYAGTQQNWVDSNPDMNLQVFIDAAEYGAEIPSSTGGIEWHFAIQEAVIRGWSGDIPADQICVEAAEAANAALQGNGD
jgi:multiple sugar transport system substrate-binding protein